MSKPVDLQFLTLYMEKIGVQQCPSKPENAGDCCVMKVNPVTLRLLQHLDITSMKNQICLLGYWGFSKTQTAKPMGNKHCVGNRENMRQDSEQMRIQTWIQKSSLTNHGSA